MRDVCSRSTAMTDDSAERDRLRRAAAETVERLFDRPSIQRLVELARRSADEHQEEPGDE
jgi:pantoate kinase